MSKQQNNFTTPEQSKQLLRLGLPANSADCYYGFDGKEIYVRQTKEQWDKKIFEPIYIPERNEPYTCIPCWSVGRLIEIAHICSSSNLSYKEEAEELNKFKEEHKCETITETIIMCIEDAYSVGSIDFSKLGD